jgi:hypothetical protein
MVRHLAVPFPTSVFGAPNAASEADQDEVVAIVDPYTSGRFLVEELRKRQWPMAAVRSSLSLDEGLLSTWNPGVFDHIIVHRHNVTQTVEALRAIRPVRAVIAGSEPGVALADELAAALGLRGNDPEGPRRCCRWDKYEMHERLSEVGLRALRQRLCSSSEDALAFAKEFGSWPLVVKAKSSHGGGGGVHLCGDMEALREAVAAVQASKDFTGRGHDVALVQEFLEGKEYVVDCVSKGGQHLVAGTWVCCKTPTDCGFIYDCTRTVPYDCAPNSIQQRLYSYVFECLTALGVKHGASHCDVVFPAGTQADPCLVRLGARMHGSMGPALWTRCAGREHSQPFLVADLFTESGKEMSRRLREVQSGKPAYKLKQWAAQVDLQCPKGGILSRSVEGSSGAWFRRLPTFSSLRLYVEEGDRVSPTACLSTSPGFVVLLGETEAEVDKDLAAIRAREQSGGMYELNSNEQIREAMPMTPRTGRRNSATQVRLRELEAEAEKLISPLASRAASPVMSPQQAPSIPPDFNDGEIELRGLTCDNLDDFNLDGPGGIGATESASFLLPEAAASPMCWK